MNRAATIHARIDPVLKHAEEILHQLGLNASQAINALSLRNGLIFISLTALGTFYARNNLQHKCDNLESLIMEFSLLFNVI